MLVIPVALPLELLVVQLGPVVMLDLTNPVRLRRSPRQLDSPLLSDSKIASVTLKSCL